MDEGPPSTRVPPVRRPPPSAWLVALLGRITTGARSTGIFHTVARHRRLSRWWLPFAGTLLLRGDLPRLDTELVVLRTAWNCASWYEWVQHVLLALRAGLTSEQIESVPVGAAAPLLTGRQRVLLEATDELHQARVITDPTWETLAAELTPEECIELCFVVGHYEMLAMALNLLGVRAEDEARRRLGPGSAVAGEQLRETLSRLRSSPASPRRRPSSTPGSACG